MLYWKVLVCVYVHVSSKQTLSDTDTEGVTGKECGSCFWVVSPADCSRCLLFSHGWACLLLHGSVLSKLSDMNKYWRERFFQGEVRFSFLSLSSPLPCVGRQTKFCSDVLMLKTSAGARRTSVVFSLLVPTIRTLMPSSVLVSAE